jgi:hypothetical protein
MAAVYKVLVQTVVPEHRLEMKAIFLRVVLLKVVRVRHYLDMVRNSWMTALLLCLKGRQLRYQDRIYVF